MRPKAKHADRSKPYRPPCPRRGMRPTDPPARTRAPSTHRPPACSHPPSRRVHQQHSLPPHYLPTPTLPTAELHPTSPSPPSCSLPPSISPSTSQHGSSPAHLHSVSRSPRHRPEGAAKECMPRMRCDDALRPTVPACPSYLPSDGRTVRPSHRSAATHPTAGPAGVHYAYHAETERH